ASRRRTDSAGRAPRPGLTPHYFSKPSYLRVRRLRCTRQRQPAATPMRSCGGGPYADVPFASSVKPWLIAQAVAHASMLSGVESSYMPSHFTLIACPTSWAMSAWLRELGQRSATEFESSIVA